MRGVKLINILFLCTANIQRSRTAEDLCKAEVSEHTFKSAGLSERECHRNGSQLCTIELLEWADQVYVFEPMHEDRIEQYAGSSYLSKVTNLQIPDEFQYMQPELVQLLRSHFETIFK